MFDYNQLQDRFLNTFENIIALDILINAMPVIKNDTFAIGTISCKTIVRIKNHRITNVRLTVAQCTCRWYFG